MFQFLFNINFKKEVADLDRAVASCQENPDPDLNKKNYRIFLMLIAKYFSSKILNILAMYVLLLNSTLVNIIY